MADVPHLIKNIRTAFLNHIISLPDVTVRRYALSTASVDSFFVKRLVEYQGTKEMKLAPKLTKGHVFPSTYEKMRVNMACQVMSHTVATALRSLVAAGVFSNHARTTAFFLQLVNNWFDLMNCRHTGTALYADSDSKLEKINEVILNTLMF
uniref:uncharacterized protein LOC120337419 n=1 Tax=Styela clava TaxID=7725 RepID=UPI001939C6D3|nr:uncharacterized protein LOC120337419 [Styela clava]